MSSISDPRYRGIDFQNSFLTGVIYDDESLTLEMDFCLNELHSDYKAPQADEEGCFKGGYIRFADIEDLQIDKAREDSADYSVIYSASGEGNQFAISSGWGEVQVSAKSVRLALD